jgi:hypothetical protein
VHDVLDPRDTVPDEAEQLAHSGYPVAELAAQARRAAGESDLVALREVQARLESLERGADWGFVEPEDEAVLLALATEVQPLPVDAHRLPDRLHGAWLGRTVGNTLGKPVEGLTRRQMETYLRAAGQWPQTGYLPLLDPLPDGVPALHPSAPVATAGRFTDVPRDDDID